MMMGRLGHLRSLYQHAFALREAGDPTDGQHMFSQVFAAQEYNREVYRQSTLSSFLKVYQWVATMLVPSHPHNLFKIQSSHRNYSESPISSELGIELDTTSSVFQIIDDTSRTDIQPIVFSSLSNSPPIRLSRVSRIQIPADLNLTTSPFHPGSRVTPHPLSWSDVPLVTNTLVPTSPIVPSTLNLNPKLNASLPLWYEPYARDLLRQSLGGSSSHIATITLPSTQAPRSSSEEEGGQGLSESESEEVQFVDMRGGRGGVWTDKGEWLSWNEVCGAFDEEVFGDGGGEFVLEDSRKGIDKDKKDGAA
jgi:hypothetical protein